MVRNLADKKKLEWSDTREKKMWYIEHAFDEKRASVEDTMKDLKSEFSYHLNDHYKEIKRHLENLRKYDSART